jgi:hypothetical protein
MDVVYGQMCGTTRAHTEVSILLGLRAGFDARNAGDMVSWCYRT